MAQLSNEPAFLLPPFSTELNYSCANATAWHQQSLQTTFNFDSETQQETSRFLHDIAKGLKNHVPELIEEGEGGSYYLRSARGRLLAVFKPVDEDVYSPRNPKLHGRAPLEQRRGIQPGEMPIREVAASLLDHQHFAGVPLTLRTRLNHPFFRGSIEGSIQRYQRHDLASWDIGPGAFEKADVQRIALLDLRLLNTDRHGGNILVRRVDFRKNSHKYKLIPIDHGMCLPDPTLCYNELYFEWENWPQAKAPFDAAVIRYMQEIDIWADVQILRGLGLREECIRLMVVSSTLVKVTVARGFSPAAIAQLMRRVGDEIKLDELLPILTGPAVISTLLFRITAWVELIKPGKGSKVARRGSHISRPNGEGIQATGRSQWGVKQRYFHRQNSAPVLFLPDAPVHL